MNDPPIHYLFEQLSAFIKNQVNNKKINLKTFFFFLIRRIPFGRTGLKRGRRDLSVICRHRQNRKQSDLPKQAKTTSEEQVKVRQSISETLKGKLKLDTSFMVFFLEKSIFESLSKWVMLLGSYFRRCKSLSIGKYNFRKFLKH